MPLDQDVAVRHIRNAAGERQYIQRSARRGNRIRARPRHLAHHGNRLGRILLHRHHHLRVVHVVSRDQVIVDRCLRSGYRHAANLRVTRTDQRDHPVVGHAHMLLHLRRIDDLHVQHVARSNQQALLLNTRRARRWGKQSSRSLRRRDLRQSHTRRHAHTHRNHHAQKGLHLTPPCNISCLHIRGTPHKLARCGSPRSPLR